MPKKTLFRGKGAKKLIDALGEIGAGSRVDATITRNTETSVITERSTFYLIKVGNQSAEIGVLPRSSTYIRTVTWWNNRDIERWSLKVVGRDALSCTEGEDSWNSSLFFVEHLGWFHELQSGIHFEKSVAIHTFRWLATLFEYDLSDLDPCSMPRSFLSYDVESDSDGDIHVGCKTYSRETMRALFEWLAGRLGYEIEG